MIVMMDEEIREKLAWCDHLIEEYKREAYLIADELARRKSSMVFGCDDAYEGRLGCFEQGIETICLHISDKYISYESDELHDKSVEADRSLSDRFRAKHVSISGFF